MEVKSSFIDSLMKNIHPEEFIIGKLVLLLDDSV